MKKLIVYFFTGMLFLSFASCKKLDLAPIDYFGSGNFWKNKSQVDGAMVGLHGQLRDYQFTFYTMGEMRGGDLMTGTGATGISSLNSQSIITQDLRESSPGISGWGGFYTPIFQVNNFISEVEKASYLSDQDHRITLARHTGFAHFIISICIAPGEGFPLPKNRKFLPILLHPPTRPILPVRPQKKKLLIL